MCKHAWKNQFFKLKCKYNTNNSVLFSSLIIKISAQYTLYMYNKIYDYKN